MGDLGAQCDQVCRNAGIQCPYQSSTVCEGNPAEPPEMVLVAPGSFTMGSPAGELGRDANDEIQHMVTVSTKFGLQKTEATQGSWSFLMGTNPSTAPACGDNCAINNVSWWDALAYANAASMNEGLPPCYELAGCTGSPGAGLQCTAVTVKAAGNNPLGCTGYRLPTESEWEYAYRAGTNTAFYNGGISVTDCASDPSLDRIGWYCGNSGSTLHAVAQKTANAWGLHDMSGNVYEWCWDWYGPYPGTVTDPRGASTGTLKVLRGGSFKAKAEWSRGGFRHASNPNVASENFGVRLARTMP